MNERKVLASGKFDVLHPGHLYYLQKAAELAEDSRLYVVITHEENVENCVFSNEERKEILESLEAVDEVLVGDGEVDFVKVLEEVKPDLIALGYDQSAEKLREVIDGMEISPEIRRIDAYKQDKYSSTKIKDRVLNSRDPG